MMTSSRFMDDYSSEDYSSDDYEDLDGFCVLPGKAATPQINIITHGPIDDETVESNKSSQPQIVTRLEVAAPDSLSSLSDHQVFPNTVRCIELADAALQAAENNVEVEGEAMTEESSEAIEADAALETTVVEDGDAMLEECAKAVEVALALALKIVVNIMIQDFLEVVEADAALETTVVEDGPDAMIEESYANIAVEADDGREAKLAAEEGIYAMIKESSKATVDAVEESDSKAVEADSLVELEDDVVEDSTEAVEVDVAVNPKIVADAMIKESSEAVEADAAFATTILEDGDAMMEYEYYANNAVEAAVALALEILVDAMIEEPPVIDKKDYSSEGDDSEEDYSAEGDAISMSLEDSVEFEDYCLQVEIDIEEYNSSEVETIEDYSSGGDAIDEFSSQGDTSEDYSSERDAISMEEWSSEDSDEEYCVEIEIEHVMEENNSSEVDTIEDYSSREDVIDEFSSQGVSIEEYFSEGERDPCKDYYVDDLAEGGRHMCKNYNVVLENYCAEGHHDPPSRSETAILVQAILDSSTIPPLFSLAHCLSVLKSCMNSFFRFGCRLSSFISLLFCKEPTVDKYA